MSSIKRDNFIQGFFDATEALVKTLVIKTEYAPMAINKDIVANHGASAVNQFDPTTWKYYMNIAGEYHPLDKPMYVTSLDTRERILFSVEELIRHTATAEMYRMGSRYYLALLREFPDQEPLINGILYPADKAHAIAAGNGAILAYQKDLVEENETTLIIELESYIKRSMARWCVKAFALTDQYFMVMFFATAAPLISLEVLRLRSDRRKTSEVHSFHLREYLASHNRLDRYLPFMERSQALYLYRNIKYIQRNAGNSFMFDELIKEILEVRNIPLDDYSIRQFKEETPEGYPVLMARRVPLNSASSASQDPYVKMDAFFNKEAQTAPGNQRFLALNQKKMHHALATSDSSVIKTKDTESSMVDLTGALPDTLPDVFMRQWVYMTYKGLYNVVVNFQDPITTEDRSLMSVDAIKYMAYLTFKSEGMDFKRLPPIANWKYRKHPRPKVEELLELIPNDFRAYHLREIAEDIVGAQPTLVECFSVKSFYDMNYKVYEECLRHHFLQANEGDQMHRSILELMCSHLFGVAYWDYGDDEHIEDWRVRNNLPAYNYTKDEALKIAQVVFERATGYKVDETRQLRYIQKAMLDMFLDLSSYSFQVMREINDGSILVAGSPMDRSTITDSSASDSVVIVSGETVNHVAGYGVDHNTNIDDSNNTFVTVTPDNSNSTIQQSSWSETTTLLDKNISAGVSEGVNIIETSTKSFNPLTGQWELDDPNDFFKLKMNLDQALRYGKFLEQNP